MKNPWLIAVISGLAIASISIAVLLLEVRFPPPFGTIFEMSIILSLFIVPQWLISRLPAKPKSRLRLSAQGWLSSMTYFAAILIYFAMTPQGYFSDDFTIVFAVIAVAFIINMLISFLFFRKKSPNVKS